MHAWRPSCPLSSVWPGRPYSGRTNYAFGEQEAAIYLACEDGATPVEAHRALSAAEGGGVGAEDIREFLEELTRARPVFTEGGPYLALALPWRLPEAV
jgi:hypothetical protein